MKNIFLISLAALAVSCSSAQKENTSASGQAPGTPAATNIATTSTAASQPAGPVALKIVSPKSNEVVETTEVPITFKLENYEVQPNGQHIHVILDNEPYQPCYDVSKPFILKNVKPGVHTIRAFPSRAWHESVKDPTAFADVTFFVKEKEGKTPVDFSKPLLTYSRPKGKYEGDKANKILFDFWVVNADLGKTGYKVRYQLDDKKPETLAEWKPTYFENLAAGKHKLILDLIDKKGRVVKSNKFNHTEREFEVVK